MLAPLGLVHSSAPQQIEILELSLIVGLGLLKVV